VSWRAQERTKRERTYQRSCCSRSLPAFADPGRRLCNRPSTPSPQYRPFAWRDGKDDAKHRNARSTDSLLSQPEAWRTTSSGSTAVRLHLHPYIGALQRSVSIERQFSPIFPAHPRSLARCLSRATSPRHATIALQGPRFCGLRASAFPGLLPQPGALGPHSGKCSSCLGSGAHSRRFAQECPEGTPGKYKQGETSWHSTKTRSL
jgi:hypothetical protein